MFESRQKARLHQEIAEIAILNKVTKTEYGAIKTSILTRSPSLVQGMQRQKSTEKDLKESVSAKDSGLEIRDNNDNEAAPKICGDLQLLVAENKALKEEVYKLKEQLTADTQIREGVCQFDTEMETRKGAGSTPVSEKYDNIPCGEMTNKQQAAEETLQCSLEMQYEAATEEAHFDGNDAQSNDDNPIFGQTSASQRQRTGADSDVKVALKDDNTNNQSAALMMDEIIIDDMAKAQGMQREIAEEMAEIRAKACLHEKNDHELVQEENDKIISDLKAENARLQIVNKDVAELVEELELDRLSSELSYIALLQGLKDNLELKLIDHQNEVQQLELTVKEEITLREEEQAKVEALEEELQQAQLESKASKESQNAEIEKLRTTIADIESRYSKAQDDFQEGNTHMKTAPKVSSTEVNDLTTANDAQKHENNFPTEKLPSFSDKFDNETNLLHDEPTCHADKLGEEEQNRRELEECNGEVETRLQEQEDMISEPQAKKRRRKGWRKIFFCS